MVNGSRTLKRRRRCADEIREIRGAIKAVLEEDHPQSVRHVFYRLVGLGLIPKEQAGYRTVQSQLLKLREDGVVPWGWVSDGTRWRKHRLTFNDQAEAVRHAADTYRRDLWSRTPAYVEVWCESDSIAGVLVPEVDRYDVPLMTSRGFSSRTYLYRAAQEIKIEDRPAYLYYVGDWDPSGKIIPEKIEETLRRFAPNAEIHFERLLVTPEQISEWDLPTKPAKKTTHAKNFTGGTVEAEAVPARRTRNILRAAIERHLDMREVAVIREAEASEAHALSFIADTIEQGAIQ